MKETSTSKKCPKCQNFLEFFVSDDFYLKGKKFYSCEVCGWKPEEENSRDKCVNGCDGVVTVCSDCPK